ncbi:MAG TPA: sigma-70 family RNA polymerase sigma factor [Thermomicrobiales bacterium]
MPRSRRSESTALLTPVNETDEAVVVALAKVDRRAFEPLYRRYLGPIFGYCYHRLGNAQAAEDATQQVFTHALAQLHTCRDESFRGWLYAIAHNVTANLVRSWRPSASLEFAFDLSDDGASPEDMAIDAESARRLGELLAQLTPEQREVIELRFGGVSIRETARLLGKSEGAIKQVQFRATTRLRSLMGLDPQGEEGRHA